MNPEANGPLIHHRVAQNILPAQSHTHFQPRHSTQHLTKWKEKESLNSLGVVNNWPESLAQNHQKASIKQNYCQEGFVPPATQQMIHPPGLHQQLPTAREQYVQHNNCTNRQQPSSENVNGHQQPIHNGNKANQQTARPQYSDSYHHQSFFRNNYRSVKLPDIRRQKFDGDPLKWNEWSCMFSSAIHQNRDITDNERMSYLQTLVVGPAREAISEYLCNPGFYHDALSELERRFGNPQHVVAALTKELELWQRSQANDHATLISYASFLRKLVQTFNAHGFYADLNSTYLVRIARDKLPWSLKMKWSEHLVDNGSPFPGLEDLSIWMDKQARACEHLQDNSFSSNETNNGNHDKNDRNRGKFNHKSNFKNKERNGNQKFSQSGYNKNHHNQNPNNNNQNANEHHHNNANRAKTFESNNSSFVHKPLNPKKHESQQNRSTNCPVDQGDHYIGKCPKFLQMSPFERNAEVKKNFLCYNCLSSTHNAKTCPSKVSCRHCSRKHHSMLHDNNYVSQQKTNATQHELPLCESFDEISKETKSPNYTPVFPRKIRNQLPMVPIKLYGPSETCECYALLDSCSTISYVFDPMVTKLNAARTSPESTLSVSTAFGDSSMEAKLVQLDIGPFNSNKPLFRLNYVYSINNWHFDDAPVLELNDVCSKHPHLQHISFPNWKTIPSKYYLELTQHSTSSKESFYRDPKTRHLQSEIC